MEIINSILNLLGWLLWAAAFVFPRYDVASSQPLSLLSTLRAETPHTRHRVLLIGGLILLLGGRAFLYWNFSSGNALLFSDFGIIVKSKFQTDSLWQMIAYSTSSFLHFLYIYYVWVLCLSMSVKQNSKAASIQNLINQQLGIGARWHSGMKIMIGGMIGIGLWFGIGMILISIKVLPEWSLGNLLLQSSLRIASFWLSFLFVILGVIGLHFINSYVYLGEKALWNFIDETAKLYLSIFRRLPLVVGRFDFAPIFGALVYWLMFEIIQWGLCEISK